MSELNTQQLIERLQEADPGGQRKVLIYICRTNEGMLAAPETITRRDEDIVIMGFRE